MKSTTKAEEWFNKMRQSFQEKLDPIEKEKYKKLGEQFYKTFDDVSSSNNDICMEEAVAYVVESLKSGIHPSYLTEDEKILLQAAYGDDWFTNWGWTHNDLKITNK